MKRVRGKHGESTGAITDRPRIRAPGARWLNGALGAFATALAMVMLSSVMVAGPALAEGSRTLYPDDYPSGGFRSSMDLRPGSSDRYMDAISGRQFLYVYAEAGEYILTASRNRNNGGDVLIYNPQSFGTRADETRPGSADFSCAAATPPPGSYSGDGRGLIATRVQELAGPNSADGSQTVPDGYLPCAYLVPATGIYGVQFTGATSGGSGTPNGSIETPQILTNQVSAWDVTVRASASTLEDSNGRLFSYAWIGYTGGNPRPIHYTLYYVTGDGYRYEQIFRGTDPNAAAVFANSRGFLDQGSPLYKDVLGNSHTINPSTFPPGVTPQQPEYPLFFSDVADGGANADEVAKTLGALGIPLEPPTPQLSNVSFVGNVGDNQSTESAGGLFQFDTVNTQTYEIVISADGTDFDPANPLNRVLTGVAMTGSHSIIWDGMRNDATPFPVGVYDFQIAGRNGEIHFPILDIEQNSFGGPSLNKLNGSGGSTVYFDDRGYRTRGGTLVGELNGHICGAGHNQVPPTPDHSLVGIDSSVADGSGRYPRWWTAGGNNNGACNNNANEAFGNHKGLDIWALERTTNIIEEIEIVPASVTTDVGTLISVTGVSFPGETVYGSIVFSHAGNPSSADATDVTYEVIVGDPADGCPSGLAFTLLPDGVTFLGHDPVTCEASFSGMPATLEPGDTLNFNFEYVAPGTGPVPVYSAIDSFEDPLDGSPRPPNQPVPNEAFAQTNVVIADVTASVVVPPTAAPGSTVPGSIVFGNQCPPATAAAEGVTYSLVIGTPGSCPADVVFTTLPPGVTANYNTSTCQASFVNMPTTLDTCDSLQIDFTYTAPASGSVPVQAGINTSTPEADTGNNQDSGVTNIAEFEFCPADPDEPSLVFSIMNNAQIYAYTPPGVAPDVLIPELSGPVPGLAPGNNLNGLMLDPVRNRLLFIERRGSNTVLWAYDAGNGGWYEATDPVLTASPDFPRGGMTADGIGYLVSGGTGTPAQNIVWTVEPDATDPFLYTLSEDGPIVYDFEPTDYNSGDIAFDGDGNGWLSIGVDLYRIDMDTLEAERWLQPELDGDTVPFNWAGIAFGDDGTLYLANNQGGPPGQGSAYYAYDWATGEVTHVVNTIANGSRDLASCAFPVLPEPELSVQKVLAEVNGVAWTPGGSVHPGDVLTYAITISNSGNAVATLFQGDVQETVPTHTSHTDNDDFTCAASDCGNTNVVNVAAGASVTLAFEVEIDDPLASDATSIFNAVAVEDVDCDDPANDCEELTPIGPVVTFAKSATPDSGTSVSAGDTLTYTLTVTVANGPTQSDVILTDVLDGDLIFGAVTANPGGFTHADSHPTHGFTLDSGAGNGSHSVSYTAIVADDATVSVDNSVTAVGGGDPGDPGAPNPGCETPDGCQTEHPVIPVVTFAKSATPDSGTEVSPGDTLTYTLTVTVANGPTQSDVVLTDLLDGDLVFGTVTANPGGFTHADSHPTHTFTLASGAGNGSHSVSYTAIVANDATVSVNNSVTAVGGGDPNDPGAPNPGCETAGGCETEHPLPDPVVTIAKNATPDSGTEVSPGDTLTYILSVNVTGSATQSDVVLTDTLGDGLTAVTPLPTGCSVAGQTVTCTLPAGATPADSPHTFTYQATVDDDATASVDNSVTAVGGGDPNDPGAPNPGCETPDGCETEHPLPDPSVTIAKDATPDSGTEVSPGDTLTYVLSVHVSGSATQSDVVLTDILGDGLTLVEASLPAECSAAGQEMTCTLAAGATPADSPHTFTYQATVDDDATVSVDNSVTAVGGGDPNDPGAPNPGCETPDGCETEHPLPDPSVTIAKDATPDNGTEVSPGDTLTYVLSVHVSGSATQSDVVLTDMLGDGLTLVEASLPAECEVAGQEVTCTLAAGATPADSPHTFEYEATVDDDATVSVDNSVTAVGGGDPNDPGAPNPGCETPDGCETEHPLPDPSVTIAKDAAPDSGTPVAPGDTLTYILSVQVTGSMTQSDVVLSDILGDGLTLVEASLPAECEVVGQEVTCTLAAGATPADSPYTFEYEATVDEDATVSVDNSVTAVGGGDPGDPGAPNPGCETPDGCQTEHPLVPDVSITKTVSDDNGDGIAQPGETLTYTITLANSGGVDEVGYALSDDLDDNTTYVSSDNGGVHDGTDPGGTVNWTGLTVPANDSLVLEVVVTVVDPIPNGVTLIANIAYETGTTPPECPADPQPGNCATIPTAPALSVTKALFDESIEPDGVAEPGEQLTYLITVRNEGGTAALDTVVNETVPEHTTFVGGVPLWTCATGAPGGTACDSLVDVPAATGPDAPGVATLTFIVEVDDPLADGVQEIANAVAINDQDPPDCGLLPSDPACVVTPTVNLGLSKSVIGVTPTGPATYLVSYLIELDNLGGADAEYTLVDTLNYTEDGVVFIGDAQVTTDDGTLNPALAGGWFTPVNGDPVQLSDALVVLPGGAQHAYTVTVPIGIQSGSLDNALCTGAPGNGLFNQAGVTGSLDLDAAACAPVSGDIPVIRLVKTVDLGVDNNGNNYGDVGDVLHYDFVISNPGTLPLTAVQLIDPRVSDLQCDTFTANGEPFYVFRGDELFHDAFEGWPRGGVLEPGDSVACTATHTLTQDDVDRRRVVNTATTTGNGPGGQAVSSTSTAIYTAFR